MGLKSEKDILLGKGTGSQARIEPLVMEKGKCMGAQYVWLLTECLLSLCDGSITSWPMPMPEPHERAQPPDHIQAMKALNAGPPSHPILVFSSHNPLPLSMG